MSQKRFQLLLVQRDWKRRQAQLRLLFLEEICLARLHHEILLAETFEDSCQLGQMAVDF
jgi:hypothetical protein